MTNMLHWGVSEQFANGWRVGSEGDDGEHTRDVTGWPYSIYRQTAQIGGCDVVLCHGIQGLSEAQELCAILNITCPAGQQ